MDRLSEIYWELQTQDDPVGLEGFASQAAAGEHGRVTPEDLRVFLRAVEDRLVRQIEQANSSAHAALGEDLVEETRAWIDDLVTKFCDA